jgi:hypothetical protein
LPCAAGQSDLAEIAILCAVEAGVTVIAVVDPVSESARFVGVDVRKSFAEVKNPFDAVVVTDVNRAKDTFDAAAAVLWCRSRPCAGAVGVAADEQECGG